MPDHCIPYTGKSENNPSDWLSFGENNKWWLHLATAPGSEQSLLMAKKLSLAECPFSRCFRMLLIICSLSRGGKLMAHNVKNKNMSMLIVALLTLFVASGLGHCGLLIKTLFGQWLVATQAALITSSDLQHESWVSLTQKLIDKISGQCLNHRFSVIQIFQWLKISILFVRTI